MKTVKKVLKVVYRIAGVVKADFLRLFWHQYFPAKPEGINMNANDICNSKCTMCNIWQQKQGFEMTPEHLEKLLSNKLFSKVKYVGITGGEPTLREDLKGLYMACIKSLPSLTHLSIITNAIKDEVVIRRVEEVNELCKQHGKHFSMMVSLDGVGEVHDAVRGREGNFESAVRVIEHFSKHSDIPIQFGATVSKKNSWDFDDLLYYTSKKGWKGRFRVAEFIVRLYNTDRGEVIRNFDEEENYNLQCFYQKLADNPQADDTERRNYLSNISLLSGKKRTMACPHHNTAVQLDSRGMVHYCAPKSKTLGSAIEESGWTIWRKNLKERRRLLKEECGDCIHDYRAPITTKELFSNYKRFLIGSVFNNISGLKWLNIVYPLAYLRSKRIKKTGKLVYVTGWYGTETVGDKAILGGIFEYYKGLYGKDVQFAVSSLYPFITVKTLKELKQEAKIVSTDSLDFAAYSIRADIVVMGGGPLMDLEILSLPLWGFKLAGRSGGQSVIFGCGIGPLTNQVYSDAVKELLLLANKIWLRDEASCMVARKWSNRTDIENTGCPARNYVINRDAFVTAEKGKYLACFLRKWPLDYKGDIANESVETYREKFEEALASHIKKLCAENGLVPHFYPMHTFHVGDDDRDFYREFTEKYFQNEVFYLHKRNSNVDFIIEKMKGAAINMCMRFHSVLFASTLNTDFIAVDYTRGGKIEGFLADHKQVDRLLSMDELISVYSDKVSTV